MVGGGRARDRRAPGASPPGLVSGVHAARRSCGEGRHAGARRAHLTRHAAGRPARSLWLPARDQPDLERVRARGSPHGGRRCASGPNADLPQVAVRREESPAARPREHPRGSRRPHVGRRPGAVPARSAAGARWIAGDVAPRSRLRDRGVHRRGLDEPRHGLRRGLRYLQRRRRKSGRDPPARRCLAGAQRRAAVLPVRPFLRHPLPVPLSRALQQPLLPRPWCARPARRPVRQTRSHGA